MQFRRRGLIAAVLVATVLAVPALSSAQLPGASVSVCQVTGSANAPNYAQVNVAVDQVAAYINQYPGSFVGNCPSSGGTSGGGTPTGAVTVCRATGNVSSPYVEIPVAVDQVAAYLNQNPGSFVGACPAGSGSGSGSGGGTTPNGSLTVCRVSGSANAPSYAQAGVAVDQLAAYLNRNPGAFVGTCPSAGDANGNPGALPTGFVTICKVTGNAASPYATQTIAVNQLSAYLSQPGTILSAPAGGCPTSVPPSSGNGGTPTTTTPGSSSTVVVNTTPNTVVTAQGAGVNESARSDATGRAVLRVRPTRRGIITVRGAGGRVVKRLGVAGVQQSGAALTG